jgi:hypothetical protein
MSISISRKRFCIILTTIALILGILSYTTAAYEWSLGVENTFWAHEAALTFGVIYEANIPSWFSAILLFIGAILAALITSVVDKDKFFWGFLACVLAYMSLDEAATLHEILTVPLRDNFQLEGFFHFGWILVGIPVALIVGAIFIPFLLRLPRFCQLSFVLAAAIYLTGAILIESYSATLYEVVEYPTLPYNAVSVVEELMEMFGVIIVIHTLLWYLQAHIGKLELSVK